MKKLKFSEVIILTALIIASQLSLFMNVVKAPPFPIGDPGYVQSNPYESNPTVDTFIGISPTGATTNAYDGDISSRVSFQYGASSSGYFNVSSFKNATSFTVAWVDFKICYVAEASTDDRYRIIYRVGNSEPAVLQDWVGGASAAFGDPASPPIRVWNNRTEPNDGVWNFTDVGDLQISFETNGVNTNDAKSIFLYEIWLTIYAVPPAPTPLLPSGASVQPATIHNVAAGNIVYVDIYVANVTRMNGYQFKLGFDPSVLTPIEYLPYHPFTNWVFSDIQADYVFEAYLAGLGSAEGFSGDGPLGRIYFGVVADGTTKLHFFPETRFVDTLGNPFDLPLTDGVFATTPFHDIQIIDVKAYNSSVVHRENLNINVTLLNSGTFYETFDVTTMYDNTTIIGTENIPYLGPGLDTTMNVTITWNTTSVPLGSHEIEANVTVVSGDTTPANNEFVNGNVLVVGRHDIVVSNVVRLFPSNVTIPEGTVLNVTRGEIIYINVTLENKGDFTETSINITTQWNISPAVRIGNMTNITLDAGISRTLTFSYNTSVGWQFPQGVNHIAGNIQANSSEIPGEEGVGYDFTVDNLKIDGVLNVTSPVVPLVPTASFTVTPTAAFVGQSVQFDASASTTPSGSTIVSYTWDFKDGNVTTVSVPTISHKYASSGSYAVILTVTNNVSLSDTTAPSSGRTVTVTKRNIAVVSVVPSSSSVLVGETLSINVTVTNQGDNSEDFDVTAYFDNTVIATTGVTGLASGASRSVIFSWDTTSVSAQDYDIKAVLEALTGETSTTDNTLSGGTVSVLWHNIAVTSITPGSTGVLVGQTVVFNVTVVNEGDFTETFTVTLKRGSVDIGIQTVTNLAAGSSQVLSFSWNTAGVNVGQYVITAVASVVDGETKTGDNTLSLSPSFAVSWHNIAITGVSASPTQVTAGEIVTITVTVVNQGNFTETFNVTAKYGTSNVETIIVTSLFAGATRSLTFTWETAGVASGSFVISAVASTVTGETQVADNSFTGNSVTVSAGGGSVTLYIAAAIIAIIVIAAILWYFLRSRR